MQFLVMISSLMHVAQCLPTSNPEDVDELRSKETPAAALEHTRIPGCAQWVGLINQVCRSKEACNNTQGQTQRLMRWSGHGARHHDAACLCGCTHKPISENFKNCDNAHLPTSKCSLSSLERQQPQSNETIGVALRLRALGIDGNLLSYICSGAFAPRVA